MLKLLTDIYPEQLDEEIIGFHPCFSLETQELKRQNIPSEKMHRQFGKLI
jgi:hypothetical protein